MLVSFSVANPETSSSVRAEQFWNIYTMDVTFSVLRFSRPLRAVRPVQLRNQLLVLVSPA